MDIGNACTNDRCDPASGTCEHVPVVCNDGNFCTRDFCDPQGGKCQSVPEPDGTACDDGNLCTTGDQCRSGGCVATPVVCADTDVCTTDACDPAIGQCLHVPLSCDDGNACTVDHCEPTCVVPDSGGTATLPPRGCGYASGLSAVPGAPFQIGGVLRDFVCPSSGSGVCSFAPPIPGVDCDQAGGTLGGEEACAGAVLSFTFIGTGPLSGINHSVDVPVSLEIHAAPRTPGDSVQSFATDLFRLSGEITGDPLFAQLRIEAGTDFGMPSPGHTTLVQSGGSWVVESYFDLSYRIDYVATAVLLGQSGTRPRVPRERRRLCGRWDEFAGLIEPAGRHRLLLSDHG